MLAAGRQSSSNRHCFVILQLPDTSEQSKWEPPSCTGWQPAAHSTLIVTLMGSFNVDGTRNEPQRVLEKFRRFVTRHTG
jgi:hypothetical protein